jgi:hypothetical protein
MAERRNYDGRRKRTACRFLPEGPDGELEPRLLLTTGLRPALSHSHIQVARQTVHAAHPQRIPPSAEINAEYASFVSDFAQAEAAYVDSLTSQSTGTATVSARVTSAYTAGSVQIQVDNASAFGANGTFTATINATASVGGVTVGTFALTGRSGNLLLVNTAQSSLINLNQGTVLSASVPVTAASSAATIFPSFINTRAQEMALNLVVYFNNFPLKLPAFNAPPHTPVQRGAIQSFVYQQVAGGSPTSLVGSLQAIPLATTSSSDLTIYNQAVLAAVEQSRQRVLSGVNQIFAGKLKVAAPQPANRLGIFPTTTTPTTTTGAALAGSTTPGTGT